MRRFNKFQASVTIGNWNCRKQNPTLRRKDFCTRLRNSPKAAEAANTFSIFHVLLQPSVYISLFSLDHEPLKGKTFFFFLISQHLQHLAQSQASSRCSKDTGFEERLYSAMQTCCVLPSCLCLFSNRSTGTPFSAYLSCSYPLSTCS